MSIGSLKKQIMVRPSFMDTLHTPVKQMAIVHFSSVWTELPIQIT